MKKRKASHSAAHPGGARKVELTAEQQKEIAQLQAMPDSEIDTSDIPELGPEFWKNAVVGKFYRPIKKSVTIRLDADVIEWLKSNGPGYQTKVNQLLRDSMLAEIRKGRLASIGEECAPLFKEPYRSIEHGDLLYDEKGLPK